MKLERTSAFKSLIETLIICYASILMDVNDVTINMSEKVEKSIRRLFEMTDHK